MKNQKDNIGNDEDGPEITRLLKVQNTITVTPARKKSKKEINDVLPDFPITEETACGIWCFKGPILQKFANKKAYVFLYGVLGCIFSASYAYFNGTITTIEKRFKIPSRTTGFITVGNDFSQLLVSVALSYYAGKGHRPRWIAIGIYTVVLFCCLTMLPHFLYGPGEDALLLTKEYGGSKGSTDNSTSPLHHGKHKQLLCQSPSSEDAEECDSTDGNFAPQALLFIAQVVSGVGGSLYYTLGVSYMDDNIQKSKTPALISFSYFIRMLGPAIGYALASFSLKFYISPTLTPTITVKDPRWLGAWWIGWIILAILLFVFASIVALFPKTLPRAAARKALAMERNKNSNSKNESHHDDLPASWSDMIKTFVRLLKNATLMCNNLAAVFYFMGYMPYWIFMPKYIETQYKQSASLASLITGTVGLVFSACGILLSGLIISKYKPRARYLAAWNVMVGLISVLGMISYAFLGCANQTTGNNVHLNGTLITTQPCNENCHCDYVTYNPICSENGETFISACHAGCKNITLGANGTKIYTECSCIKPLAVFPEMSQISTTTLHSLHHSPHSAPNGFISKNPQVPLGTAVPGACPIDCMHKFYIFLAVVCLLKFSGATGRASNFLVSVRCVDEKDKTVAMGFGLAIMSLFAFIPSPILFGYILDATCIVWGKTCSGTGNCWLYDGETLRYLMNFTAAGFVFVGMIFDIGVWYYVKDVKIFDEEEDLADVPKKESKENP